MSAALGNAGLLIALVAASVGALATSVAIIGENRRALRQAPIYAAIIVAGSVLAVVAMQWALFSRDYSIDFVQRVGSSTTPALYNVAAMWSALEGSILLWVIVLALFTGGVALRFARRRDDELVAWALVVMYVVMTFFALVSFGPASPFAPGATVPVGFDGPGPNTLLHQNRVDVRRSRQPGKKACILNRVPGPPTTPSKNLVTPPTAKQDADGQQAP